MSQTTEPERSWSSLLEGVRQLGESTDSESRALSTLRTISVGFSYLGIVLSGLMALFVVSRVDYLSVGPVAIGWTMLLSWFSFYHWAAVAQKSWTAWICLFFTLATAAGLGFLSLGFPSPTMLQEAAYLFLLKYVSMISFFVLTTTSFHFASGFYIDNGG